MNDKTIYISGQLFFLLALFILNTVSARLLGPAQMGIWNLVNLIAEYGFVASLGIINGMGREIPLGIGRGDSRDVDRVTFNALFTSISVVMVLLVAASFIYDESSSRSMYYTMGIFLLASRIMNSFTYILIRSWQHFIFLGMQQFVMGGLQFACLLLLFWYRNLPAVLIITMIPLLAGSLFALKYVPNLHSDQLDFKVVGRLVSTGFPIYLVGIIYSLFATTDRILITSCLGVKQLGLYTPAMIAVSIISLVPTFVANIMYPKLTQIYGRTNNYEQMKPCLRKMIQVNVLSTLLLSVILYLAFKLVVIPYFLTEYAIALYPMATLLVAAVVSSVGHGFGDFFNAIGKQRIYLVNVSCALVINVAAGFLLIRLTRLELMSVSLGTLIAVIFYSTMQVISARKVLNDL